MEVWPRATRCREGSSVRSPATSAAERAAEAAPRQNSQPCDQVHQREGLGQVVVGAQVERGGLVILTVLGGEHQHGRPHVPRAHPLENLVPLEAGQHGVDDHDVVVALCRSPEPVDAVGHRIDLDVL